MSIDIKTFYISTIMLARDPIRPLYLLALDVDLLLVIEILYIHDKEYVQTRRAISVVPNDIIGIF